MDALRDDRNRKADEILATFHYLRELLPIVVVGAVKEAAAKRKDHNYPRWYLATTPVAEVTRALRAALKTHGWRVSRTGRGLEMTVSGCRRMGIIVRTGDEGTARLDRGVQPSRTSGDTTVGATSNNEHQLDLFDAKSNGRAKLNPLVFMLLFRVTHDEVRLELSMPSSVGKDGWIPRWVLRALATTIQLEVVKPRQNRKQADEPTVEVKKIDG